ncbi:dihydrofolate reductase family protein [Acidimicrobiaceae bacterium AH-315-P05]|nr:dihydrofolate reductase family protein [Acidimicrobiaceae bacterium AH-315-P05]
MRELAILTFVTLDGVMQAPHDAEEDPTNGFTAGGWALGCWDEVMTQVEREAMAAPYDLLLGRATYDSFAEAFSASGATGNDRMTNAVKYVATSDPDTLSWQNTIPLTGDIAAEIVKLKLQNGPLLQVHGSWELVQTLIANDLVDEYRLWTFPVLVGHGKRLFQHLDAQLELTLRKAGRAGGSGATMAIYRRTATRDTSIAY